MSLRNVPDETSDETIDETMDVQPAPVNWPLRIAKIALGGVGIGAGVLYLGPAEVCSMTPECGAWLSEYLTQNGAIIVFSLGGADFSAGAMLMGANSAEAIIRYLKAQQTLGAKVGKGGLVLLFTLTQNVSLLFTSLRTSSAPWQTILSVLGNIPATVYGTISYLEKEIPYFISLLKELGRHLKTDCSGSLTKSELEKMKMMIHYQQQQTLFINSMNNRFSYIESYAENIVRTIDADEKKLGFLFKQPEKFETTSEQVTRYAGNIVGMLFAFNFTAGGVSNTVRLTGTFLWQIMNAFAAIPFQAVGAMFVNASVFYGNVKYATKGISSIFDAALDIVRGVPIRSAMFRLKPKLTAAAAIFGIGISTLSYAVIVMLFYKEFHVGEKSGNKVIDDVKLGFLINAAIGINVYHFASVFHLIRLIYQSLTPDEQIRFILDLEDDVERLNKMTLEQFKEFVETNTPEENQHFNIIPYTQLPENDYIANADTVINAEENDIIELKDGPDLPPAKVSWTNSFCNFFSCCWNKPAEKPVTYRTPLIRLSQ